MNLLGKATVSVALVLFGLIAAGCPGENNRTVTKEEAAAADTKRQSFIDGLNIPESQKAQMKAHMGGPPAADPAAAAKAAGSKPADRKN